MGVEEGVVVADDIGGVDGGQESDLVESRVFLFFVEAIHLYHFDCEGGIGLIFSFGFDDSTEAAASEFHE